MFQTPTQWPGFVRRGRLAEPARGAAHGVAKVTGVTVEGQGELAMSAAQSLEAHRVKVLDLTPEAFAPFGQVIKPRKSLGQFVMPDHNPGTSPDEAQLTLHEGIPRMWIMHLTATSAGFVEMARHNRVTQCLGSLGGAQWLFAVAAPTPPDVQPTAADIVGFRIPGDRILKLHIGTWHAGPHLLTPEALFLNLENMNTRREDFEAVPLDRSCHYDLDARQSAGPPQPPGAPQP